MAVCSKILKFFGLQKLDTLPGHKSIGSFGGSCSRNSSQISVVTPRQNPPPPPPGLVPTSQRQKFLILEHPSQFNKFESTGIHFMTAEYDRPIALVDSHYQNCLYKWGAGPPASFNLWGIIETTFHIFDTTKNDERKAQAAEVCIMAWKYMDWWKKESRQKGKNYKMWDPWDLEMCDVLEQLGQCVTIYWQGVWVRFRLVQVSFNPRFGQDPAAVMVCEEVDGDGHKIVAFKAQSMITKTEKRISDKELFAPKISS